LMNIVPEWLSGSSNLNTKDPIYLWIYIIFFNAIWVFFPLWVLKETYSSVSDAFTVAERVEAENVAPEEKVLGERKEK
ncbi:hypothetical protein MMC07_002059, partial [Pseudocyphellaria aurata]|nr:hypothetical protein [Pseudocyphellaria aurata]